MCTSRTSTRGPNKLEKLERDRLQLWGEAAHYQSQGESLTIDPSMWPDAGIEQEKRRVKDPWEAVLAKMPEVVETKRWDDQYKRYVTGAVIPVIHVFGDQERVASSDLLLHILEIHVAHQTVAQSMRLANVMKALGWQRASNGRVTINGEQVTGYFRWVEASE